MKKQLTASILIIGNEILSGRIQDKNVQFIAKRLADLGISLKEVRVIPDIEKDIIEAVNLLRQKYTYLFTTGGIGPTHDDITVESVAKAFGVDVKIHEETLKKIEEFYKNRGQELNKAREKMAYFPVGAEFINNDLTKAPGFKMENVFVMAGIPEIMNNMFSYVEGFLERSNKIESLSLKVFQGESMIAEDLSNLQNKYPEIDIGSYPFTVSLDTNLREFRINENTKHATDVVFKGSNKINLDKAYNELKNIILSKKYECE